MDERIKKMQYYPGLKRKEILPFPTVWMNLDSMDKMLRQLNQTQKDRYPMISLMESEK